MAMTLQGFFRQELRAENLDKPYTSFLAFQLLPEVFQARVLKSRFGLSQSQCHCLMVISIPEGTGVGGLCGEQ